MGVVKRFFNALEENKKKQMMFFLLCMLVLILSYIFFNMRIKEYIEDRDIKNHIVEMDYDIITNVEMNESTNKKKIKFAGWVLRLNSQQMNMEFVLQSTDGEYKELLDTKVFENKKVNAYFDSEENVGCCGFETEISKSDLYADVCYELYVVLDYINLERDVNVSTEVTRKKVSTGRYIYNGHIYKYNPTEYVPPKVTDEKQRSVVTEGELLACDDKQQFWVYKNKNQLYCIVEFDAFGEFYTRPEIPMFIYYHDVIEQDDGKKKLNGQYISKYISENEFTEYETQTYYMYEISLTSEVEIVGIETGIFQNDGNKSGWISNEFIKFDIEMKE